MWKKFLSYCLSPLTKRFYKNMKKKKKDNKHQKRKRETHDGEVKKMK